MCGVCVFCCENGQTTLNAWCSFSLIVFTELQAFSSYFNLPNPVWCWSSVCPHRAIVNPLHPASTQCGVGPVCVPIELLSTYFNLPTQCGVGPVCVPIELFNCQPASTQMVQCVSL